MNNLCIKSSFTLWVVAVLILGGSLMFAGIVHATSPVAVYGADITHDGSVNGDDLTAYANNLGRTDCSSSNDYCGGADINKDGRVDDSGDLGRIKENWRRTDCTTIDNSWCNSADITRDGSVNGDDLTLYANNLGRTDCTADSWCEGADINKDGRVDDSGDLGIIGENWRRTDCTINNSWCNGVLTVPLVNDVPTITLNGSDNIVVTQPDTFTDLGATCSDVEDVGLVPTISGTVDVTMVGTYTLTYTCTDSSEASASTTRTVSVQAQAAHETATPHSSPVTSSSGHSQSGGHFVTLPIVGQVLGASTSTEPVVGQVLGASTSTEPVCSVAYLESYIKLGAKNNPIEVKKLQTFLNEFMSAGLPITGFYGPLTFSWVNKFQVANSNDVLLPWARVGLPTGGPTGYVYKTTKRWINILKCPDLLSTTPVPALP